jgi:O-antigen/teichoic acid export membrane protein
VFPEISYTSSQESDQAAAKLVEDSLAYTGLIAIPGLIGGIRLGDRLLQLYGEEFVEGAAALGLLIFAVMLYSYHKQLMGGLNGLNRPNLAFRVNAVFIALNASLNLVLIWQYGIEGAALASVFSTAVFFVLAYYMVSQLIPFEFPYDQIARQWIAALAWGAIVLGGRQTIETTGLISHNAIIVAMLVGLGAGVYFLILFGISTEFRKTIARNLPTPIPFINK